MNYSQIIFLMNSQVTKKWVVNDGGCCEECSDTPGSWALRVLGGQLTCNPATRGKKKQNSLKVK